MMKKLIATIASVLILSASAFAHYNDPIITVSPVLPTYDMLTDVYIDFPFFDPPTVNVSIEYFDEGSPGQAGQGWVPYDSMALDAPYDFDTVFPWPGLWRIRCSWVYGTDRGFTTVPVLVIQ